MPEMIPMDNPSPIRHEWDQIAPDLRAALVVALFIILLEVVGDAIPVVGWLAALPFSIPVYLFQGILTGAFSRGAPGRPRRRTWIVLGLGARSAVWTGALSLAAGLVTAAALLPVSLGASLVSLPVILASFGVDFGLNLVFSILGAWIYTIGGGRRAAGFACLISALFAAWLFLLAVGLLLLGILSAAGLLPHPALLH